MPNTGRVYGARRPRSRISPCATAHFRPAPRSARPPSGWPVLYLLDGNAAFDLLRPAFLQQVPGLMLVGVGYDTGRQIARERRMMDFTAPDGPGHGIRPDPVHPGRLAEGVAQFLDRLAGRLRREAETGLPVDPARRSLWGHSFGGLFTLYALLTQPPRGALCHDQPFDLVG